MILFLFLLAEAALESLPTADFVALRQLFLFRQYHLVLFFSLKPVPFYKLCAGLGSTSKSTISFLLSPFSLTLALSSTHCPLHHLSFHLKLSGTFGRNCLLSPFLLLSCNGFPDIHLYRKMTQLMSWSVGVCYSCFLRSLFFCLSYPFFAFL